METIASSRSAAFTFSAYSELTKPRVTLMVVLTAAAGFYLGTSGPFHWLLLLHTLIGTGLLSAGTAVLNQYLEREADSRMKRTALRPLPAGILTPLEALVFGMGLVTLGTLYLLTSTNAVAASLGWLTSAVYLLVYTPLKKRSSLCTLVGAIPGAVPPLIGWAAASGTLNLDALVLFGILFSWQFPHFLAIAWLYREDYERGGFKMLPEGERRAGTGLRIFVFSLLLLLLSLVPMYTGLASVIYLSGALILGATFVWYSLKVALNPTKIAARQVLKASVGYLPLLLILLVLDKA